MTVEDIHCDVTRNRLCGIDAATIEIGDVGIVNLPMYVAGNHLLCGTGNFIKAATTNVTLCIVLLNSSIWSINT